MDERIREAVFPVRIILNEGSWKDIGLLTEPTDLQIGLDETHLIRVKGRASVVLDFGCELHGGIRILTQLVDGGMTKIRIRTGESVSECCAELGERGAHNHHALRDIETSLLMYSDLEFLQTGFRFARIDFLEDKELLIKAILAVSVHRDLKPAGSFVCSDERVNEIFRVAARTLMLNMQNYIWDGIKRDRLVWIGDMHPETTGIVCLFGADPSVERSLSYCREHTPLPNWMNRTPTYTAWWLIILYDYYLQNGNYQYIADQKEYIKGALLLIDTLVAEDGSLIPDEKCLFDWPSHGSEDEEIGILALLTLAANKARELFKLLELDVSPCDRLLAKLSRQNAREVKTFKQCAAFQVYAGIKSAKDAYGFLTANGAHGFSTFLSYYLLSAIADSGDSARAVELMKEYYGGMLELGATSFWEDFDLDWMENSAPIDRLPKPGERDIHGDFGKHCYVGFRQSLCHGWSCGPVPFLIKKLGGIEPLEPGCKRVRIAPKDGGLDWYELKYPTPFGCIEVIYRDGKYSISVPEQIEIVSET